MRCRADRIVHLHLPFLETRSMDTVPSLTSSCPSQRLGAKRRGAAPRPFFCRSMVARRPRHQGFTLIEVMIVVTIIGILAAIALPSYQAYVQRSARVDAKTALLEAAQWMERAATATGQYPAAASIPDNVLAVPGGRYSAIVKTPDGNGTADAAGGTFLLTTKPTGSQAKDSCTSFTLSHVGARGGTATSPQTVTDCWNR